MWKSGNWTKEYANGLNALHMRENKNPVVSHGFYVKHEITLQLPKELRSRNKTPSQVKVITIPFQTDWLQTVCIWGASMSGRFTDFVINLWEGLLTAKLLSQSVIQPSIKHLPELLSVHVHICIKHLEPVEAGGVSTVVPV